jgi:hypothetical protein
MIEIATRLPATTVEKMAAWLGRTIRPQLTPDVSRYARGRLRAWLQTEPTLTKPWRDLPGIPVGDKVMGALAERIGWEFDYCLVTYSGDGDAGTGIHPHRDASYADYEAYGLHLTGECRFDYWMGRPSYGFSPETRNLNPLQDEPTHRLILQPGDVVRFNCKNIHSATPGPARWNINFWRRKALNN